jgi:predicted ester cyclase
MKRLAHIRNLFEGKADPNLFSPKYVSHAPWDRAAQRGAKDRAESEKAVFNAEKVFTDLNVELTDAFEEGDKVVVRWTLRGTWTNPIPGVKIKPTGRSINVAGINVYHFAGEQIVEKYGQFDVAAFHAAACAEVPAAECVEALREVGTHAT